jgi:oxygen-independent coproporphyrinogen-3 oxidase
LLPLFGTERGESDARSSQEQLRPERQRIRRSLRPRLRDATGFTARASGEARSPCFYCGCNRIITRDKAQAEAYLARLYREIAMTAAMFDRDREVVQLHFGGGTPNFLSPAQLHDVVDCLRRHFHFAPAHVLEQSIELDPRGLLPDDVRALAAMGFNRASLGVQDFDPAVQAAVNRMQTVEETAAVIEAARAGGMKSVNVDLIYGLPTQTQEGFGRTLDTVLAMLGCRGVA